MKRLLVVALLFSAVNLSAQTVTRKVGLAKGQQLEQLSQVNMNITQEMMGQVMEITMESTITNLLEVKDNAADGFAVANTLKKVLMNMNAMGQEMKFDSDKPEDMEGQIGQGYKDKVGKTKEFTVNKEGIITEIKNKEEIKDDPGNMFGNMMSSAEEKEGAGFNALSNIPAKGVKVGDSWSDSTSEGDSKVRTTYTLKEVNGNDGIVSLNSDMTISRQMEQQGMAMQMDMKGNTTGEYTFDVNTGIIKSRKATTKASGNVDVSGQSIPMTMEMTVVSTVTKKS